MHLIDGIRLRWYARRLRPRHSKDVQIDAVAHLTQCKHPNALRVLTRAIEESAWFETDYQIALLRALKHKGNAGVTPILLRLLADRSALGQHPTIENPVVIREVVQTIESFGDQAANSLIQGLADRDFTIVNVAGQALGRHGNVSAIGPILRSLPQTRAMDVLLTCLNSIDEAWASSGEAHSALPDLVSMLSDRRLPTHQIVQALKLLNEVDPHWTVRYARAGLIHDLVLLSGTEHDVRVHAIQALDGSGRDWRSSTEARSALPDLFSILLARNLPAKKRGAALIVLNEIDQHWALTYNQAGLIECLIVLAGTESHEAHHAAIETLDGLDKSWRSSSEARRAVSYLVGILGDKSFSAHWCDAIRLLQGIADNWKPETIRSLLASGEGYSALNAIAASQHGREAISSLFRQDIARRALPTETPPEKIGADTIGLRLSFSSPRKSPFGDIFNSDKTHGKSEVEPLSYDERKTILMVMEEHGRQFLPDLLMLLKDRGPDWLRPGDGYGKIRNLGAVAADIVGKIGDLSCIRPLTDLLQAALGAVGPVSVGFEEFEKSRALDEIRQSVLRALALIGGDESRRVLVSFLRSSWERMPVTDCFESLATIGGRESARSMLSLFVEHGQIGITDYPDPSFPKKALGEALVKIGAVAVTPILEFVKQVRASKLQRLPLDVLAETLVTLLNSEKAASSITDTELTELSRLPDLWRVQVKRHYIGEEVVDVDLETRGLDCQGVRDVANKRIADRRNKKR